MWNNIIGQDAAIDKLRSMFKSNKLSHAYIFYGNTGVGKDAAAIELAKLVNCLNPVNGDEPCDKCENCKKISQFKSEYFHFVCALPAGRSDQSDNDTVENLSSSDFDLYLEQIEMKALDPYYHLNLPAANNIRINSIRDIISKIYLSTSRNYKKVFIISEAEKMKQEAANALLKILEEPPKNSLLILTTSKINSLPPTVVGRCQSIHFLPLNKNDIINKINDDCAKDRTNVPDAPKKEIELAARLSGGSYTRTVEFLNMGIKEIREQAISFLISTLRNDFTELVSIIRSITGKNNKDKTKYFLFFLNAWFDDIIKVKYINDADKIANIDLHERLVKFDKNYSSSDIYNIILSLEEAEKLIGQNVQLQLILVNLSFKLKNYLH
ncbi:MAG: AAA family ATPase [Ignavibacteriae bacterium]|nr:MAG: AAA family ATPase [Ignavibacteriota bacterium]